MSVYAVADLHGNLAIWNEIEKFLKPEDKIYILGDCGDRGTEPWRTIKAVAACPQAIYLKDNHEDMLVNAMKEYCRYDMCGEECELLFANGGYNTLYEWILDGAKIDWTRCLDKLPLTTTYTNENDIEFLMSHAGFNPTTIPNSYSLLWGREHLPFPWNGTSNQIVIHGHTPNTYIARELKVPYDEPGALYYCGNHKIGLDTGCYTTNFAVVLDLDTLEEHIFYVDKEKE